MTESSDLFVCRNTRICFSGRCVCATRSRWRRRRRWMVSREAFTRAGPPPSTSPPHRMRWLWWKEWRGKLTGSPRDARGLILFAAWTQMCLGPHVLDVYLVAFNTDRCRTPENICTIGAKHFPDFVTYEKHSQTCSQQENVHSWSIAQTQTYLQHIVFGIWEQKWRMCTFTYKSGKWDTVTSGHRKHIQGAF